MKSHITVNKSLIIIFCLTVILISEGCRSAGGFTVKYESENYPVFSNDDYEINSIYMMQTAHTNRKESASGSDSVSEFFNRFSNYISISLINSSTKMETNDIYEIMIGFDPLRLNYFYELNNENVEIKRTRGRVPAIQISELKGALRLDSIDRISANADLSIEFKQTCREDSCEHNKGKITGNFIYKIKME